MPVIESTIKRKQGSRVQFEDRAYHFTPNNTDGAHVAAVEHEADADRLLAITEGFRLYAGTVSLEAPTAPAATVAAPEAPATTTEAPAAPAEATAAPVSREDAAAEYKALTNKGAHYRWTVEKILEEIAEAKAKA